jgi:hypothetical protein
MVALVYSLIYFPRVFHWRRTISLLRDCEKSDSKPDTCLYSINDMLNICQINFHFFYIFFAKYFLQIGYGYISEAGRRVRKGVWIPSQASSLITMPLIREIIRLFKADLSADQISGRLGIRYPDRKEKQASPSTIYSYLVSVHKVGYFADRPCIFLAFRLRKCEFQGNLSIMCLHYRQTLSIPGNGKSPRVESTFPAKTGKTSSAGGLPSDQMVHLLSHLA